MTRRPIHTLVYAESGAGKSSFARTFPKPMLVFGFDPLPQLEPYMEVGKATQVSDSTYDVHSRRSGDLLIRVESYVDPTDTTEMRTHAAALRFNKRVKDFKAEFKQWATCTFDSVSAMSMAFRKYDEYVVNAGAKDRRQWYGAATFGAEDFLMWRLNGWPMNVVVLAHTDYDKAAGDSGVLKYRPKMPGQSLGDVMRVFSESYHAYTKEDNDGNTEYWLQTQNSGLFPAASRIHAPNPCRPHYKEIWANQPVESGQEAGSDNQPDSQDGNKRAAVLPEGTDVTFETR